ncbi:MAG: hypothetical protein K1X94_08990 [Sandaracinaceae bacterium]|nr:hypothetical protein [Sandaracinaceae bacterium]
MRPIVYGPDTPRDADAFHIDWSKAVEMQVPVDHASAPYLVSIARYTNWDPPSRGLFAHRFRLSSDPELDRLLGLVHALPSLAPELAARLLARSSLRVALRPFGEGTALEDRLRAAAFVWNDPFVLEGTLARHLYGYGMYRHFYEDHDADAARSLARTFVSAWSTSPLESLVPLETRAPWGAWFDEHSCTDRTFLLLDRASRAALLLAFSHSD